ncbi:MAG TPA: tryptophan--tRNA ligase [Limnochordia bacterium]|nr:tryptophan--tRNA ligase [Limnochordia bacterium]
MGQRRIFSGIQPSGTIHVGNYLGAIQNWTKLQYQYESIFCVVDYHAITVEYDPRELSDRVMDVAATLLACGIDPERAILFVQSAVPEHTELSWLLTCITPLGMLERMTQFKDKAARQERGSVGAGLLCYPVLMAADILLYKADLVPVGDDQIQHLELTRDLARKFNHLFGQTFPEPEAYVPKTARIMALSDPTSKMSKSIPGGAVALAEEPEQIRKLVRRAVTDSGPGADGEMSPGVKNLFVLLEAFGSPEVVSALRDDYARGQLRYVDLKDAVAEAMIKKLTPIRERRAELLADRQKVIDILDAGAERARALARETLREVKERMGFTLERLPANR